MTEQELGWILSEDGQHVWQPQELVLLEVPWESLSPVVAVVVAAWTSH